MQLRFNQAICCELNEQDNLRGKQHGKYAATTADLGAAFAQKMAWGETTFETAKRGYTATAGEKNRRWSIAQDSRLLKVGD